MLRLNEVGCIRFPRLAVVISTARGLATFKRARGESGEEDKPMANARKSVIRTVRDCAVRNHLVLVIVLSAIHIGLATLPTWNSGRADLFSETREPD